MRSRMLGLIWPWKTKKKGRTIESVYKNGNVRVLCIAGGSPVTGEITIRTSEVRRGVGWPPRQVTTRRTPCPECGRNVHVTGPANRPRLYVHNPSKQK